jgi:hypothetical protein
VGYRQNRLTWADWDLVGAISHAIVSISRFVVYAINAQESMVTATDEILGTHTSMQQRPLGDLRVDVPWSPWDP